MAIYKLRNVATEKYLNIDGSNLVGSHLDGQDVTIWTGTGSAEQLWIISSFSTSSYIRSYMNRNVFLNAQVSSGLKYNCNVRKFETGTGDTLAFESATGGYKIKLKNTNMYLTVNTSTNGTSVYWSVGATTNYQVWKPERVDVIDGGGTATIYANGLALPGGDLTDSQTKSNARYIYNFLIQKGFTKKSACAVLGNMEEESSFNPGAWQYQDDVDYGYSLLQWTKGIYFIQWLVDIDVIKTLAPVQVNNLANSSNNEKRQLLMDAALTFFMWTGDLSGDYFESSSWTFNKFKKSAESVDTLTKVFYEDYIRVNNGTLAERQRKANIWYNFF